MAKQCMMCFKRTDILRVVVPHCPAQICKACGYKIDQSIGFLEYNGVTVAYQLDIFETPPAPPDLKSTERSIKKEARGKPLATS